MALKITRDELDEYRELLERKAALATEAAALKEAIEQFEAKAQQQLVDSGKPSSTRFGWVFALCRGNKSVSWKKEFIALAGKDKAIELADAGKGAGKLKLNVTPPQDLAHLFAKAESEEA